MPLSSLLHWLKFPRQHGSSRATQNRAQLNLEELENREVPATALDFSTYLGGSGAELPRAVTTDAQGNTYVAGGTFSADFPRTTGPVHQGKSDAFVTKFDPNGDVIWSRLLGGPNFERVYDIQVNAQGSIFIAGRAGQGFPVTLAPNGFSGSDC